jgi:hypothetical protein
MVLELVNKLPYDHPYRWDGTAVGGKKLWRPDELGADLALWLDAEDTASITLNGSTVSQWDDKSGNNRNASQATASLQPTYLSTGFNGKPTLETDGNDILELGATSLGRNVSGITCAIVGVHPSGLTFTSNTNELFIRTGVITESTRFAFTPNPSASTGNRYAIAGRRLDSDSYQTVSSSTDSLANRGNQWIRVGQAAYSDGVANHWTDGTQDITSAPFQTAGVTSDTDSQRASIFGGVNPLPSGSQLCEIVLTHSTMTTADRQKLEGYLAWKWGLESNLPIGHPYKLYPPYIGEPVYDSDAQAYITAVETADGQTLEASVKTAINNFVLGCKADGIWNAIKSSAILAGARTLSGALIPLTGTAPTNFNFVSGDYDRKTGLKSDGATKYLDSNRNNDADPQNSYHLSVFVSQAQSNAPGMALIGAGGINTGASNISNGLGVISARNRNGFDVVQGAALPVTGFLGTNRNNATNYTMRSSGQIDTQVTSSETPANQNIGVFTRDLTASSDGRIAFYSIGEALDLALLDTRTTRFMAEMQFAINTGLNPSSYNIDTLNYVNAGYAAGGTLA